MSVLELIIFIFFTISVLSFVSLAPWVPTRPSDYKRVNNIVKLKDGERFLEMGCGIGGVSFFLAKNNKNAHITGIELSIFLYLISKIRLFFSPLKNIDIKFGNALKLDLSKYDVLYCFGLPETVTKKVFPKIKNIKNKNFRFISYCFKMTNNYFNETKHKPENKYAIYEYKL